MNAERRERKNSKRVTFSREKVARTKRRMNSRIYESTEENTKLERRKKGGGKWNRVLEMCRIEV